MTPEQFSVDQNKTSHEELDLVEMAQASCHYRTEDIQRTALLAALNGMLEVWEDRVGIYYHIDQAYNVFMGAAKDRATPVTAGANLLGAHKKVLDELFQMIDSLT